MNTKMEIVPEWAIEQAYKACKQWAERTGQELDYANGGDRIEKAYQTIIHQMTELEGKWNEYLTTNKSCLCPDYQNRQKFCYHILAMLIVKKAKQLIRPAKRPKIQRPRSRTEYQLQIDSEVGLGDYYKGLQEDDKRWRERYPKN